jgi:subtilisin family serine protease
MRAIPVRRKLVPVATATILVLLSIILINSTSFGGASNSTLFTSPFGVPSPLSSSPLPTPMPSNAAQDGLLYIAGQKGIPVGYLQVVADHPTAYSSLGRNFQVVTVVDTRPSGQVYKLLVDLKSGSVEENISNLLAAEGRAQQARYGKLEPALYKRLQDLESDDSIPVGIWIANEAGTDSQVSLFKTLGAKFPEAQNALRRFGKPMDVDNPYLAKQIEAEYVSLLTSEVNNRIQPLAMALRQRGITVTTFNGMPSIVATLSKQTILEFSRRADISRIYLVEGNKQVEMGSAAPTILAPAVWKRGYNGNGITIAILDLGNVDPNNAFLHVSPITRTGVYTVFDHATETASAAASFTTTYKGIAYGATILSVGEDGTEPGEILALQWAIDHGAYIINNSGGFGSTANEVGWIDKAFDYWARQRFITIIKSSGNSGGYITGPGKAWNVITVGGFEDDNDANWQNDQIWASSSYTNPIIPNSDREKPEVVAVAKDVTVLSNGNSIATNNGTSMAAPQVAGLAALLHQRNPNLAYWPEATKAIIMASATHNITGPTTIVQDQGDLRDGAGAVNADLADNIARFRADASTTCDTSCWWGHQITTTFAVGTDLERSFYAQKGNLIRVAISWWSNADLPGNDYSFDRLDTDLDLRIKHYDQYLSGIYSLSHDNNYEMVEFVAPADGIYKIVIRKHRADEPSNYLGIALARIQNYNYLPAVLKIVPTPTVCGWDC